MMCNKLHEDYAPIKEKGHGYKIFEVNGGNLFPMVKFGNYVDADTEGFINWDDKIYIKKEYIDLQEIKPFDKYGFCFFLTKKEARRALENWVEPFNCRIYKISYDKGLGKHKEKGFISYMTFTIGICQRFKILEEVK